jgi:predicted dehydrogenase
MSETIELAPLQIGVVGLGRAGSFHIERLSLRDDCRITATYDDCPAALNRSPGTARRTYRAWQEFLADDQIELVLVASPPASHAEMTIAALAAGKHVVVETPLCLSVFEADAIADAVARCGRQVFVAHTRRWEDDFRRARSVLETGELGRPVALKLINWHYGPAPPATMAAQSPSHGDNAVFPDDNAVFADWRNHSQSGGGMLWEFGVHYFDQLLQLAAGPAESVFARPVPSAKADRDDGFLAIVNFSSGLVAHVEVCRTAAAPLSTGWMIIGDRGSYAGGTQFVPSSDGEVVDTPAVAESRLADEFYAMVVQNLRCGGPHPVPLAQVRQTIALIEAARRSARTGQVAPISQCVSSQNNS